MRKQIARLMVFVVLTTGVGIAGAGNIDPNDDGSRYAYAQNIGWLNWEPLYGPGVSVSDANLTGYLWGQNVGWVNLDPNFGGVHNDGTGKLSGFAWGRNIGWINFAPKYGGVVVDAQGCFEGWAWGQNIGWIHLRSHSSPHYGVRTSWLTDCRVNADDLEAFATQWLFDNRVSLVGYWAFETGYGTVATDLGMGGNALSLIGDAGWNPGKIGNFALDLDGSGDYARSASVITGLDFAPGSFTASAWIRPRVINDGWRTILEYDRGGDNWFGLWVSGDGKFHFRVGGNRRDSIGMLSVNEWYHVAGRYDSQTTQLRLYVNGEYDSMTTYTSTRYESPTAAKLTIGVRGTEDDEYFDGLIDDVRIYARMLDERDIRGLMWGTGTDFDNDGDVDFEDYASMAAWWLDTCPPGWPVR